MTIDRERLRKKGWTEKEIYKALRLLHLSHEKKTKFVKSLDFLVYWFLLLLVILGNFIISVTIVPILLVMSGAFLIFMLIFIALVFGYLFTKVIIEVQHFQKSKVVVAELLIPAIGLINIYMIAKLTNLLAVLMELKGGIHNPIAVSFLYVFSFSIPRIYFLLQKAHGFRLRKPAHTI